MENKILYRARTAVAGLLIFTTWYSGLKVDQTTRTILWLYVASVMIEGTIILVLMSI